MFRRVLSLYWLLQMLSNFAFCSYNRDFVNIFSPEGELTQPQQAVESSLRGETVICSLTSSNSVIICCASSETDSLRKMIDPSFGKIVSINDKGIMVYSGLAGDGFSISKSTQDFSREHFRKYRGFPSIVKLTKYVADHTHHATLTNVRPLGVSCIFVGFDKNENDLSIMLSDPLGDYSSWSCISIGKDSDKIMSILNNEYIEEMPEESTIELLKSCFQRINRKENVSYSIFRISKKKDTSNVEIKQLR